MDLGYSDIGD